MHGAHVPHDAILHDGVTLAPNVVVGGISQLLTCCNIGMGASIHQNSIIGHYSIVATNAAVIKNVKPFSRYIPGKSISVNTYAIHKYGFEKFESEIEAYVLENVFPESTKLVAIINQFETLHLASKRGLY